MRSPLLSVFLISVAFVAFASSNVSIANTGVVTNSFGGFGKWFDYVVVIMMENHSINFTYDNGAHSCLGNCTYFTSLANAYGLAEGLTNNGITGGSIGDYIAITSGFGNIGPNCNANPVTTPGCLLSITNIVDRLEAAHLTWKVYEDGYPISSGCYNDFQSTPNHYGPNHNPFLYYSDIQNNATRCNRIVNANTVITNQTNACGTVVNNDDLFVNDLQSISTSSNYMFLTPNDVDDIHDCNNVDAGNAWLNLLVPQILSSTLFSNRRAALFITFDEPDCTFSGCPSAARQIYSVWASPQTTPVTKLAFKNSVVYTLFSSLKTVENNWGLPPMTSTDMNSNDMHEFFP